MRRPSREPKKNTVLTAAGPGSCGGRDERQFFTGDTNFAGEASLMHFDLAPIYSGWLTLAGDTQRQPGEGAAGAACGGT